MPRIFVISNLLTEFALLDCFCFESQFNWLVTELEQAWLLNQDSNAEMDNISGLSTLNEMNHFIQIIYKDLSPNEIMTCNAMLH